MEENNRKMFDEIRVIVENKLYNSLFIVYRDENYAVNYNDVSDALKELSDSVNSFLEIIGEDK